MVAAVCEQVLVNGVVSHRDVDSWWGFRLLDALPHRRRCGLDCGRVDPSCRPQQLLLGVLLLDIHERAVVSPGLDRSRVMKDQFLWRTANAARAWHVVAPFATREATSQLI